VAASVGRQWLVLDLAAPCTVGAIALHGAAGPQLPRDIRLEVSDSVEGPWRAVAILPPLQMAPGESTGPVDATTGVFEQRFTGFCATAACWRILILRGHGAEPVSLARVELFGVETAVPRWFAEQGLTAVTEACVRLGFNQLADHAALSPAAIAALPLAPGQRRKLNLALTELRTPRAGRPLTFASAPPRRAYSGQPLRAFAVHASPQLDITVRLTLVDPPRTARLSGTLTRRIVANGITPGVAVFDDIVVTPRTFPCFL
jgi:hypothetical protein